VLAARIDVQAHAVTDFDRLLGQIDSEIEEVATRGRAITALTVSRPSARAARRWLSHPSTCLVVEHELFDWMAYKRAALERKVKARCFR
jgi:hypothetical protein